ncbi:putative photosynthetic complex assembly protein PuhE [Roseicitreum antarcticum]|uniref:Putative photosynthetic complex assembly protein 2 n=1 Tax=Roseicitreum antarcticum TaxID=564137 RepID=A0A1H2QJQ7_9RHOB|nr:putative photosynthetic complex assembly protein PuhE [Roseicitreum antarcticum]SDW07402.1 putative photosynthetic complex assembly protein 2 [Roseicitreum antarcticum]
MAAGWAAALFALFIWWFSTGVILCVVKFSDREGRGAHVRSVLLGLPVLLVGLWGFDVTMGDASVIGVYLAFLSALAIWGWVELAFLAGVITGPAPIPAARNVPEWERFLRAWGTIAYHEMLLIALLLGLWFWSDGVANPFGFYTFAVLFFARISAKLNLFYGVPKINVDFLPDPLRHLSSHFRIARLNWVFPVSVSVLTFAAACWVERLIGAGPAETVGFALLAALTALAALEHWLMVLPLPDDKLWRWMLPAPKAQQKPRISEETHGL